MGDAVNYSRRSYISGQLIFDQDARANEAFLITKGEVRLEARVDGKVKELATIGVGKTFGELGPITGAERMARAVAVGETDVITCNYREFQQRVDDLAPAQREAIHFLISYCQDLLPYDLHEDRPNTRADHDRDDEAANLLRPHSIVELSKGLDNFMTCIFKGIVGYAKRRLPPALIHD